MGRKCAEDKVPTDEMNRQNMASALKQVLWEGDAGENASCDSHKAEKNNIILIRL